MGNTTYFGYDATLKRIVQQVDPNLNITYYRYVGGGGANQYALALKLSAFNQAQTYFGYVSGLFDLAKQVGPRQTSTFSQTTYYQYDAFRNRTVMIDALGETTLYGRDSEGHLVRMEDARGNTTYYNYNLVTGNLDSQSDALGDTAYYGYSSFRDKVRDVSPRWVESTMAGFTTYFVYDQLARMTTKVDPLNNVTYWDYTARSLLLDMVDAVGTDTVYTYSGLRLMTQKTVTNLAGTQLTQEKYGYDIYKNRTALLDGRLNATYYFYDQIDRLTSQVDALKEGTYYFYDAVGNRTVLRDARGNSAYYSYDLLSRNTVRRDALGNASYFFYDLSDNRTIQVDPRGSSAYFFFDQLNRQNVTRDALANPTYFYFDLVSNRSALTDARFNTTYYFYDSANRNTVRRDAVGNVTYFGFDAIGNRIRIMDARLNTTYFIYDAVDRLSRRIDALADPTYIFYDAVSNRTQIMDARFNTTYYFYDGLHRMTAMRDALADPTYIFYDATSNETVLRNPNAHATYFGYDAINRLTQIQDALGKTTYFTYDSVGNQTQITDADNHTSKFQLDTINRLSAIRFPDTGSAYFFYDPASNRTKDVDPIGKATYYAYDALDRAIRVTDALLRTIYFEYDPLSNLSREVGAEGESAAYTYDALNRQTNIAYTVSGAVVSASLGANPYFIYDPVSNLTQMGDLWGLHLMGYDAGNRLVRRQFPNKSVIYFEYDPTWNVTTVAYPGTSGRSGAGYDAVNRQIRVQAPSGATAYFAYDAASNQTQRFLGNSATLNVTYDPVERVATWRNSNKSNSPLSYFDYSRDAKGLITKAVREATYTVYFTYDPSDRLASEIWAKTGATPSEVYGFRYAYDVAGNRLKAKINGADTYYFYDKANQLTVKGTNAKFASPTYYIYDKNGSLTNLIEPSGKTYFAYNAAGLVARIRWRDATATYFFYDGALRRYGMVANGTPTYFLWNGLDLLQEQNADGTVKEEHTNAQTPIAGIAQLVETNRPGQVASLQKIYPCMDPRGTITKWVESDGTTILASREYDAFGTIIPNSPTGTWPGRWGYQGQAWLEILSNDGTQRFLLSPTRFYNPTDGIFFQRDPLIKYAVTRRLLIPRMDRLIQSVFNLPKYTYTSPTWGVDPTGLKVQVCCRPANFLPPVGGVLACHCWLKLDDCGVLLGMGAPEGLKDKLAAGLSVGAGQKVSNKTSDKYDDKNESLKGNKPDEKDVECKDVSNVDECCLEKAFKDAKLPDYKVYSDNSNTFIERLLKECGADYKFPACATGAQSKQSPTVMVLPPYEPPPPRDPIPPPGPDKGGNTVGIDILKVKCYITTAVCEYFGKPDDCYELQVLRTFRDTYMRSLPNGEELIAQYYETAPAILDRMRELPHYQDVLRALYFDVISPCVKSIEIGDYKNALDRYVGMVRTLSAETSSLRQGVQVNS